MLFPWHFFKGLTFGSRRRYTLDHADWPMCMRECLYVREHNDQNIYTTDRLFQDKQAMIRILRGSVLQKDLV